MNILFLHQNFPGQFLHIAVALQRSGAHRLVAITDSLNSRPNLIPTVRYSLSPDAAGNPHPLARYYAERVARGERVANAMSALKGKGFEPDIIIGHPGWGEMLFARDIWRSARIAAHCEYYTDENAPDLCFDPEFSEPQYAMRVRINNAVQLQSLHDADFGISPTAWQASRFPSVLQQRISVVHEGIDTAVHRPNPLAEFETPNGRTKLKCGQEIISYVSRNLEPYRGYHTFMRVLPEILARRPNAHAVIVGGDSVSYSPQPPKGTKWKDIFLQEVRDSLPPERVHFTGRIPYEHFRRLMQVTSVHVYPTYPFVLSWSVLEAMSAGALVVASDVEPVREIISHEVNGLLFDYFDRDQLITQVVDTLANPARYQTIRQSARETIQQRYDLHSRQLPEWLSFVKKIYRFERT